ncbi:MAG: HAD hydrolase family protein, partial [Dehalococcoidia bacterium]
FEVISRYDDLLTLEGRENYEPGDTLALIVPFLAYHGIKEEQIDIMGQRAALTPGASELVSKLRTHGWQVFCASTSYEQYATGITQRLGIPAQNVACTSFPLNKISQSLTQDDFTLLEEVEKQITNLSSMVDDDIKKLLDHFYWQELPQTKSGKMVTEVKPMGGSRKVKALEHFAAKTGEPLSHWVTVGDSITDFNMLQAVDNAGGLAISFNANEYALPYSTMSLASTRLDDLWVILETWDKGERSAVEKMVREKEEIGGEGKRGHFHWLAGSNDITEPLKIHSRIRRLVRKEAAKLG